jgi:hypothetical protein
MLENERSEITPPWGLPREVHTVSETAVLQPISFSQFSRYLSSPDIVDKLCPSKRRRALLEGARRFDLTYAA